MFSIQRVWGPKYPYRKAPNCPYRGGPNYPNPAPNKPYLCSQKCRWDPYAYFGAQSMPRSRWPAMAM